MDHGKRRKLRPLRLKHAARGIVVYAILFKDDEKYSDRGGFSARQRAAARRKISQEERTDRKKILHQISKDTGGRLYEVSKKETVDKTYSEIEEELRNQYSLAYTPGKNEGPGYHKIAVTTQQKDLLVQARDGYYATQPLTNKSRRFSRRKRFSLPGMTGIDISRNL